MCLYPKNHEKTQSENKFVQLKYENCNIDLSKILSNNLYDNIYNMNIKNSNSSYNIQYEKVASSQILSYLENLLLCVDVQEFGFRKIDNNQVEVAYKFIKKN